MYKLCLYIVLLFSPVIISAQVRVVSVSGFITDIKTGSTLSGTNIQLYRDTLSEVSIPLYTTESNIYGYFNLPDLRPASYYIVFRLLGYKTAVEKLVIGHSDRTRNFNISLEPVEIRMGEVIIEGRREVKNAAGTVNISPQVLSSLPTLSGEKDVFKLLEFLPGISKSNGLTGGLYVRGGSPDQTLTLVDNTIFYNPSHLGNIASSFNSDALRDIKLIKGAFPAEYGGRLSSVIDIKLRSGTREKDKGSIGLGLINSYLLLEGPMKEGSTYLLSGRWMYYDQIQKHIAKSGTAPRYRFYDVSCKVNNNLSESSSLSFSAVYNNDHAYNPPNGDVVYNIDWKNLSFSVNWLKITSGSVFLNTTLSLISYRFSSRIGEGSSSTGLSTFFSQPVLTDYIMKETAEIDWHAGQKLKTGLEFTYHRYDLLYGDYFDEAIEKASNTGIAARSFEAAYFIQNESKFFSSLNINAGVRACYFNENKMFRAEPRFSASCDLSNSLRLKAAASLVHQFLHLIVRNDMSLPSDLWYPSSKGVEPGRSVQYMLGAEASLSDNSFLVSAEGYYRSMQNLYEYRPSAKLNPLDYEIYKQFVRGEGEAYGVELFVQKSKGNLNGWIGYTLSWTKRKFDKLNNGRVYFPRYDSRHDISVAVAYSLSENLNAGMTWTYATGQRYTQPGGQYIFDEIGKRNSSGLMVNYPDMNESLFPAYHKMDLNLNYYFNWLGNTAQAYLSLYNVYNRHNVFAQFTVVKKDDQGNMTTRLKRLSLFPFIPSLGIRINF